ncbi:MAG TPA: DUF4132 domain-containing protein [Verrucomicrobiota bacterium]|nr:hypothetical protein [Verrucomicrobiales bacterium]HRI11503.1 DUF4132 domain-containing protein [Verrucomicrobiota bacterium]
MNKTETTTASPRMVRPPKLDGTVLEAMQACFAEVARHSHRLDEAPNPRTVAAEFAKLHDLVLTPAERARLDKPPLLPGSLWDDRAWKLLTNFITRPEFMPVHLVRFALLTGAIEVSDERITHRFVRMAEAYRCRHPLDLKAIGDAMQEVRMSSAALGRHFLWNAWAQWKPFRWGTEAVARYFREHTDLLVEALTAKDRHASIAHRGALEVLAQMSAIPKPLIEPLWKIAWTGPKPERPLAQPCLEKTPDCLEQVKAAVGSKSADVRAIAANWLCRIGDDTCEQPLLEAVMKEADELARAAMMSALERLQVPLSEYLTRESMLKEAAAGLAKKQPKELEHFPFDQLPAVHWADNKSRVAPEIVRWWIVQGCLAKNPQASPLLKRIAAEIVLTDRERLGQFVLETWIDLDTSPRNREALLQRARTRALTTQARAQKSLADLQAQMAKASAKEREELNDYLRYLQENAATPFEDIIENELAMLREFDRPTAIGSKGVLSVAAAMCGPAAVPVIKGYLNEWYGTRAAQCCALLQLLGCLDDSAAIQLMLAVGARFRTKSIQQEAARQTLSLAERKGWTVDEMADRTAPDAGLDESGALTLDYGHRRFTARLLLTLEFALEDAAGKPLKTLPTPLKNDDAVKAAESKKLLMAARKGLASVVQSQTARLFEAMCTQRSWRYADWDQFLNHHLVLRHLCQRLVWSIHERGRLTGTFRALPDQSLTDLHDAPVRPAKDAEVRLVHESLVTPAVSEGWRRHFADYKVEPLFAQLGKAAFQLEPARAQESDLLEFLGHLVNGLKLRRKAAALGLIRGPAGEGGWFTEYQKHFASLGVIAVVEFTGNAVPERDLLTALKALRFAATDPAAGGSMPLSLGEVPPVLLSECWNDLRQIAAEGSGFDPDWEKKTQM